MSNYLSLKLDNQVCFSLYRAINAMVRNYKPLLEPLGLTYPQYIVMMVLWEKDNVSVRTISEHTHLDSGTLTPLLKRLAEKGLLMRNIAEQDEREKRIVLTEKAKQLEHEAAKVQAQMLCKIGLPMETIESVKHNADLIAELLQGSSGKGMK